MVYISSGTWYLLGQRYNPLGGLCASRRGYLPACRGAPALHDVALSASQQGRCTHRHWVADSPPLTSSVSGITRGGARTCRERGYRTYNVRPNHLCKVTTALLPRAGRRTYNDRSSHLCKVITVDIPSPLLGGSTPPRRALGKGVMGG